MKKNRSMISLLLASALLLALAACGETPKEPVATPTPSAAAGQYTDGVFDGVGVGMGGDVPVTVTVKDGKITGVAVGENSETEGISTPAMEQIPTAIVEKQTPEVDAVAGATITSGAIMEAVKNALSGKAPAETAEMPFEQADIIVAGAGLAGLSSAVKAAELGAKVILIEQTSRLGGSATLAGGFTTGVNTRTEAENGVEDSVELMMEDFNRIGGEGTFLPDVARKFAENCGRGVDWLDDMGVDFALTYGVYDPLNVPRAHQPIAGEGESFSTGSKITDALTVKLDQYMKSDNVYLLTNTTVTALIYEDKIVKGVVAEQKDGSELSFTAPSTILATGGYAHNEEMLKKYHFENVISSAPSASNGSGFKLLDQVGATYMNMDHIHAYGGYIPTNGFVGDPLFDYAFKQPIWVDVHGERLTDESAATMASTSKIYHDAEQNLVYYVFPESLKEQVDAPLSSLSAIVTDGWAMLDELALAENCVFRGDNVEELAQAAGIDPAGLKATINQYNADVDSGKDSVFGRTADMVRMEGPLYIVRTAPDVVNSAGGPVTNDKAQIIREDGSVVEGAYVVGELAGFSNYSGRANIGGICLGGAIAWGMLAAEDAVSKITK